MRKLIVDEWMTLDGIVQGPSSPEEDTEGGFEYGGWQTPYFDEVSMKWTLENVISAGGYLLGRRTYEIFAAHWPNAAGEEQAMAEPFNTRPKYVASTTLREPLEWQNYTLLEGDVPKAVAALKQGERRQPARPWQHQARPVAPRTRAHRRVPADDRPGRGGPRQASFSPR